jgi:DNA-binding YbaB/EbfC family protein
MSRRGPNVQEMLARVEKVQKDMEAAQRALRDESIEASAGGGAVKVCISGDLRVRSVSIDPSAVDPEDVEMLSEVVMAAVNEAIERAQTLAAKRLEEAAGPMGGGGLGGLGLPGF